MRNIKDEIQNCLRKTGKPQRALALISGVPAPTICTLLSGKRKDIYGSTLDALRDGMRKLEEGVVEGAADG